MADDGRSLGAIVSCANCGQEQKIMKRCTRCAQIFYCSRQCQVKDWPVHKIICNMQKKEQTNETLRGRSGELQGQILNQADGISVGKNRSYSGLLNTQECKTKQELCVNAERPTTNELQQSATGTCSKGDLEVKRINKETTSFTAAKQQLESYSKSVQESGDTCRDEDIFTIYIKHNKSRHKLKLSHSDDDRSFLMISEFLHIPSSRLKLIHKGKMIVESNIKEFLQDKALFLAFGEVAESEEGLENGAVDTIMKQLGVERNAAIRALKKTGCIIDAIIELGNR